MLKTASLNFKSAKHLVCFKAKEAVHSSIFKRPKKEAPLLDSFLEYSLLHWRFLHSKEPNESTIEERV